MKLNKAILLITSTAMMLGSVPSMALAAEQPRAVAEYKKSIVLTGDKYKDNYGDEYFIITPTADQEYIKGITKITVNNSEWDKNSKDTLYGKDYYIDQANNRIMFAKEGLIVSYDILKDGDVIEITNPDYETVKLKVSIDENKFAVKDMNETVKKDVKKLKFKESSVSIRKGESTDLELETKLSTEEMKSLKWKSDNEEVVTVKNGKIKALKAGKAKITVSSADNDEVKDTCTVTVTEDEISLNKSKITLEKGESYELKATVTSGDKNKVKWSSSNEKAVTVKDGKVKAVAKGEAVITATTEGGATAKCTVTVENASGKKGGKSYSLEQTKKSKNKDDKKSKRKESKKDDKKETKKEDSKDSKKDDRKDEEKKTTANTAPAVVNDRIFDDVSTTDTRYAGIKKAYEKGWMTGVGDKKFAPDDTLTRGMAAQILWNKAGKPEPSQISPFLDVTSDAWYAKAVAWAYENKIISGYDSTTFGPDDYVTTEQFNLMLDISNGKTPQAYVGGAPNAQRGWVAVKISE